MSDEPIDDVTPSADTSALANGAADGPVAAPGRHIEAFFDDDGVRRQVLEGFDPIYADIVHYIIRCTHRIWEEGGLGRIYDHYAHNSVIHTTDQDIYGSDAVVAGSARTMAAFPDLLLYGDDVVWAGDEKTGYHTSHRLTHIGTNLGHSTYGPPTGHKMRRRAVAHCIVKDGYIIEEWLARDELAAVRALGLDEIALARELGAAEAQARGGPVAAVPSAPVQRRGQLPPEPLGDRSPGMPAAEHLVRTAIHDIWNRRRLDQIAERFAPNLTAVTSTNRTLHGVGAYKQYVLEWLAACSDLGLVLDHTMANERQGGWVVATRWILEGTHDGPSPWGPPTGRRLRTIGFTHHLVQDGRITAEWTVYDEFSILKQIHTPDWAFTPGARPVPDTEPDEDLPT